MEHIRQQTPWDCGIAALAMFLDLSYEQVAAAFPFSPQDEVIEGEPQHYGLHPQEAYQLCYRMHRYCWYLDTKSTYLSFAPDTEGGVYKKRWEEAAMYTSAELCAEVGRRAERAMLQVDSWQNSGDFHWVVYNGIGGRLVHDPHFDRPGRVDLERYTPYIALIKVWT